MKTTFKYIGSVILTLALGACNLDQYPYSETAADEYVTNAEAVNNLVIGTYNGLHDVMYYEWAVTELRSDNTRMRANGSTSQDTKLIEQLDQGTAAAPRRVAVTGQELPDLRVRQTGLQEPGAVYVQEASLVVDDEGVHPEPPMRELELQGRDLAENTMRVGVHPEHASALHAGKCRRAVTDDAFVQVRNGGLVALGACLVFEGTRLMEYYVVGKSPFPALTVLRPHGI